MTLYDYSIILIFTASYLLIGVCVCAAFQVCNDE